MSVNAQTFPGIYFDVVQPQVEDKLPRMDIASFVGYASAGPVNTPVAVDDVQRFREIFGQDIELAWDSERNQMEKSLLGMSVEAFFRNGGRRCWIVRVADEALAQTAHYEIPGLIRCNASRMEQTSADARSPGSWAKKISINTLLQLTQLPFAKSPSSLADEAYFSLNSSGWVANLIANALQLENGDVISLRPYADLAITLYLIVDNISATSFGVQLSGTRAFLLNADTEASPNLFDSSLALNSDDELAVGQLFPISSFDALGITQDLYADEPISSPIVSPSTLTFDELSSAQLLRFEIIAKDNNKAEWRLSQLGFTPQQPRFWGVLPSDKNLFQLTDGRSIKKPSQQRQNLLDEVDTPRFPLASSFADSVDNHEWLYLPIGIPVFIDSDNQSRADFSEDSSDLSYNGIENAGSLIFVDERLSGVGSDLLKREGHSIAYLSENSTPLTGIHSLLTVEEATLISVPDAGHRRWDNLAPPYELPLEAPEILQVSATEINNEIFMQWTQVDEASAYRVEWSEDADFSSKSYTNITGNPLPRIGEPVDLIPEPDTDCYLLLSNKCPRTVYFRVRSENREEVSVWSNNIARRIPEADFVACDISRAEPLALNLELNSGPIISPSLSEGVGAGEGAEEGEAESGYLLDLEFNLVIVDESSIDSIEIQKSNEFTFINPEIVFDDSPGELDVEANLQFFIESEIDANAYYRARAIREGTFGPWSNTVIVWPSRLGQTTLQDKADFSNTDILSIHRALLRLCYARGDLFGVLSLPKHYTVQEAQDHFAQLSPTQSYDGGLSLGSESFTDALTATVYPINSAEKSVCSHGGIYFPWVATQTESLGQGRISNHTIPPDGCVLGKIAGKSLEQGPWIAPANSPIVDVLALETNITRDQWANLMAARINVIRDDSRGFLLLSADTLSDNSELTEINVRRLMSMLMRLVHREGNRYVFEPNSAAFHERVQQYFEGIFDRLYSRGAFAGKKASDAYRVVTDSSVNTVRGIEAGRFIVELHVAPSQPLKFIRVRLVQTGPSQVQVQEIAL